ncbi:protein of unknown function [Streptantibioticus cattleyicolor NRRL 8057 = DSM 46488]|nr:protein of unknown function [Streptantibioticus cattleyicolor NRRL 8057 = DSM 46488]
MAVPSPGPKRSCPRRAAGLRHRCGLTAEGFLAHQESEIYRCDCRLLLLAWVRCFS